MSELMTKNECLKRVDKCVVDYGLDDMLAFSMKEDGCHIIYKEYEEETPTIALSDVYQINGMLSSIIGENDDTGGYMKVIGNKIEWVIPYDGCEQDTNEDDRSPLMNTTNSHNETLVNAINGYIARNGITDQFSILCVDIWGDCFDEWEELTGKDYFDENDREDLYQLLMHVCDDEDLVFILANLDDRESYLALANYKEEVGQ